MDNNILLEMKGITKKYPGVIALNKVNLSVKKGSVHALVGENGAGKSTLMKVLSGFIKPDEGEIFFNGEKIQVKNALDAIEKGIIIIHQELNLVPEMTVAENLFLGREPVKNLLIRDNQILETAQKLLDDFELHISARTKIKDLSISQMQMVEIIKAVSHKAKIILMDEPTSAISASEVEILFHTIDRLSKSGVAIVYISHRMDEIFQIADTVTILRDGNFVGCKTIDELNKDKIVAMMVGREVQDIYPQKAETIGKSIIEVKNLNRKGVFENISFTGHAGEIVGIAGLMGAGRTEVVRCIFGLDSYDSGEILIEDQKVHIKTSRDAIKCGIAMATEDRKRYGLVLMRSIKENISLPNYGLFSRYGFIKPQQENEMVESACKKLAVKANNIDVCTSALSGGNQQKVVFAKWILASPKVLILDEPTRGIDVGAKFEIYKIIRELADEGISVIVVSSELPELIGMSDRVYVMRAGQISAELKGEEITQINIMNHATADVVNA